MASLKELLIKRECKGGTPEKKVYLDSRRILTVGVGHKVVAADRLNLGDEVDDTRVNEFFKKDTAKAVKAAQKQAALAGINNTHFEIYLASVNFQLGTGWTKIFKKTWAFILEGKYEEAADEVGKSRWYIQTPVRAKDFQQALRKLARNESIEDND